MLEKFKQSALSLSIALALALPSTTVIAQNEKSEVIEEIIVTGTRKAGVSPTETLSPTDVLTGGDISNQAAFDMTDGLTKISPSINTQRFPIADGTAFIRPVSLRNLSPDQTLVLVNGTRRHRSPLVNLQLAPLGTVNQGAQAVDFSTIPTAAIKRIEVLRDGASAQYGSDAIAGVVNVILKDANEGFTAAVQSGEYSEGDGARQSISANAGFALGDDGFLNMTVEKSTSEITSRGIARPDAAQIAGIVGANLVPINGLGQRWGDPDVDTMKLFVNAEIGLGSDMRLFSNISSSDNTTLSDFFYRGPVVDNPALMIAARGTLQVDANNDFIPDNAPLPLITSITDAGLNPADYLVASVSSPTGYVLRNPIYTLFPGGYNPNFGADISDLALVFGLRGDMAGGIGWNVTIRSAESEADYQISETINPSLGRLSPTTFRPGTLTQEETSLNANFVQSVDMGGLASALNLAYGLELREETYKIGAGDNASVVAGPTYAYFGVGSDGFQGFSAESAGSFSSDSTAVYVDLEADIIGGWSAGTAFRFEDYDQFDSTSDFKLSSRYQFTDSFALRATFNTGFRAPTPGQVNTLNVTTTSDSSGNLIPNGTYPVYDPIAAALGAVPLKPEESTSYTIGAVILPGDDVEITLDIYNITVEDRLALRNNTIGTDEVTDLIAGGIPPVRANMLLGSSANFFVNGFESEISGIDLAVNTDYSIGSGLLSIDFRHNNNKQEVSNVAINPVTNSPVINGSRVFDLENQIPKQRSTLTFNYDTGALFSGLLRFNRYGSWKSTGGLFNPAGDASDASTYGSEVLLDLEVNFKLGDNFQVALGGENFTDVLPDDEQDGTLNFLGVTQSLTSPFGFNGAFYYLRASASF